MVNEQTNSNKFIAQVVAKAATVVIQRLSTPCMARAQNVGPRMNGPIIKQPTFDWSAKDKYTWL